MEPAAAGFSPFDPKANDAMTRTKRKARFIFLFRVLMKTSSKAKNTDTPLA
jgi:hypothetical protein